LLEDLPKALQTVSVSDVMGWLTIIFLTCIILLWFISVLGIYQY